MARLPDVAGESQQPAPQPSGGVASYEPPNWRQVGMAGQIISSAGRDFGEAANMVSATNSAQDSMSAMAAGNSLKKAGINQEFDAKTGFRNAREGAAVGQKFIDTYTKQFEDSQTTIRSGLANDNQRRIFDQHAEVQGLQFRSSLLHHQATETDRFNDTTENNTVELALRGMAQRPADELGFQSGLAQINSVIDGMSKRKGYATTVDNPETGQPMQVDPTTGKPSAITANLKSKYLDAAYTTRITSIMDGIPGAVQADPAAAERMFKQVQGQLGPAAQVHLGMQVQRAMMGVQQRDIAQRALDGRLVVTPQSVAPAVTGPPLQSVVQQMESGGNPDAVSPKGATGIMQVMPATAENPGYGVRPVQRGADGKPLPGEVDRVGRDYLGAMTARYQDPALILAAYNAGPGQVDQWLTKYGDPRTGQVSAQDWAARVPFKETRDYVSKGIALLGQTAPTATATKRELKTQLPEMASQARAAWEQMYPGDASGADAVEARVYSYGNRTLNAAAAQQGAAVDTVDRILNDVMTKGGTPTVDDVLSNPAGKQAWGQLTPVAQRTFLRQLASGEMTQSDQKLVSDLRQKIYLPFGDPNRITQPWQITQYAGTRLNYTDTEHLRKEIEEARNPEGADFAHRVNDTKNKAEKMITSIMETKLAHPDLGYEAANRFSQDLDKKLNAARVAKIDPEALLDATSKDYVLNPSRVVSFMPTEAQIVADKAKRGHGAPAAAPVKITNDEDFNKLPSGAVFLAPDGSRRRKP